MNFTFSNTPKIIFGEGRLEQITSYISKFGNKTLVITGKSFPESVYGQKFSAN